MNKIIIYLDADAVKPLYANPIIINTEWAYQFSSGFGISYFGTDGFGDPI